MKKFNLLIIGLVLIIACVIRVSLAAEPLKVAMVAAGTLGDRSFYDSGNEGLVQAAEELGVETKVFECRNVPSAFSEQIIAAAQSYDVVFTIGWELVDVAPDPCLLEQRLERRQIPIACCGCDAILTSPTAQIAINGSRGDLGQRHFAELSFEILQHPGQASPGNCRPPTEILAELYQELG